MRSVFPGTMDSLGGVDEEPDAQLVYAGAVSVIGDGPDGHTTEGRVRRFPTVYLGNSPVFADRDMERIRDRVQRSVDAMLKAETERPYVLQPCLVDGVHGLYWRDIYNRSAYRRKLARSGVSFSEDPYPRFSEKGTFTCEDWGEFTPRLAILGSASDGSETVTVVGGGLLVFGAAAGRFGRSSPEELGLLARTMGDVVAVTSESPEVLVDYLRDLRD